MSRLVDLYPYCIENQRIKFLIFKRAKDVIYANQWRMIGGKVRDNEKAWEAALRELNEETGLEPELFWTVPTVNQFYDPNKDALRHIPVFGAEVDPQCTITLNHEHTSCIWISVDEVEEYIKWPEQKRIMKTLSDIVTRNEILEEWII